jgi:radical SAM superfamily enzyme YgiQ (UPF0313 family)
VLRQLCCEWPRRTGTCQVVEGGTFDQSDPSHIDWDHYIRPAVRGGVLWMGASRGCAYRCRYCIEPERGAQYSRYAAGVALDIVDRVAAAYDPRVIAERCVARERA